jgi:predicted dehydrogenase
MTKIGFAGVGYWGPNLLRNFEGLPDDVTVAAICDADQKKLSQMKKTRPHVKTTADFNDLVKDGEIDAVVIALPAKFHYEYARKALEAGKDVFVEKPLAMTGNECRELIKLADEKKRIIFVGHTFIYNSAVKEVKKYIDSGSLGSVYYIYSHRLNLGKVRDDVDVMWNLAPHDISIMSYLLGSEPRSVSARGFCYLRKDIADVAFITIEYKNGVSAHIHVSWLDPNKVRRVTIVGSKKMVVYDDVSEDSKIMIYDKGIDKEHINADLGKYDNYETFLFKHRSGDILIPKINFEEPLRAEVKSFVDCVKTRKKPATDGNSGLEVVKVLEAASKSLKDGGKVIEL